MKAGKQCLNRAKYPKISHGSKPVGASRARSTALASCPRAAEEMQAHPPREHPPPQSHPRARLAVGGPGSVPRTFPAHPNRRTARPCPRLRPAPRGCPSATRRSPAARQPAARSRPAPQPGPRLPSCRPALTCGGPGRARSGPCARRLPPPLPPRGRLGLPGTGPGPAPAGKGKGPRPPPLRPPPAPLRRRGRGPRVAVPGLLPPPHRCWAPGPAPPELRAPRGEPQPPPGPRRGRAAPAALPTVRPAASVREEAAAPALGAGSGRGAAGRTPGCGVCASRAISGCEAVPAASAAPSSFRGARACRDGCPVCAPGGAERASEAISQDRGGTRGVSPAVGAGGWEHLRPQHRLKNLSP